MSGPTDAGEMKRNEDTHACTHTHTRTHTHTHTHTQTNRDVVANEIFDMVMPAEPYKITLDDLQHSRCASTVTHTHTHTHIHTHT
jgi:hypothetical protein